jgi:uncharacterized protein (TIGR02145 family)
MKTKPLIFLIAAAAAVVIIFTITSCQKDDEILIPKSRPTVETLNIEEISAFSALAGGIIKSTGGSPVIKQGVCFSDINQNPDISDNCLEDETLSKTFQLLVEDLEPNTLYHLRAFAQNEIGVSYGEVISFTTVEGLPVVETLEVEDISFSSALAKGIVHDEGDMPVFSRGICLASDSLFPNLNSRCLEASLDGDIFEILFDELIPDTDYYVRAYAVNELDSAFGKTVSFKTLFETVTDIDGNEYRIHTIGEQTWMIDNLKTTRFNNGDPIPLREQNQYWTAETALDEPAYCWYQNDESYADPYGALYNFEAAADPRNICPDGWRVPTDDDRKELVNIHLGGPAGGGALKTTGTIENETGLWYAPNTAATNETGFSAIPAGFRHPVAGGMGYHSLMWTSESAGTSGIALGLAHDRRNASTYYYQKHYGFSIRCIKE